MRRIISVALLLAACSAPAVISYRNPERMISSSTAVDPARFQGDWQVVAAYGGDAACGRVGEQWAPTAGGGFSIAGSACIPPGKRGFKTFARPAGPGRLVRDGWSGPQDFWVLWVDADYRVAAIGAPDGRMGRIMARPGADRADLITAARQILSFNGYDISQLKMLR